MKTVFIVNEYVKEDVSPMEPTEKGVIKGVFSTQKLAQKFIESGHPSHTLEYIIEEYELDRWQNELDKGYRPYFIRMKKSGEVVEMCWTDLEFGYPERNNGNWKFGIDVFGQLYFHSFAESDKQAIEMCEQVRMKIMAEGKWSDQKS